MQRAINCIACEQYTTKYLKISEWTRIHEDIIWQWNGINKTPSDAMVILGYGSSQESGIHKLLSRVCPLSFRNKEIKITFKGFWHLGLMNIQVNVHDNYDKRTRSAAAGMQHVCDTTHKQKKNPKQNIIYRFIRKLNAAFYRSRIKRPQ